MAPQMLKCVVFVLFCINVCTGVQYVFTQAEYEANEGDTVTVVKIKREAVGNEDPAAIIASAATITINDKCPAECPAEAEAGLAQLTNDYTFGTSVTFLANSAEATVTLSIAADDVEEHREYFCLQITTDQGNQFFTRIVIPWNDHCVSQFSIFDEGADHQSLGYFINNEIVSVVSHVGPWDLTQEDTITLKVTPQPTTSTIDSNPGDGNNLNIFIANRADINGWVAGGAGAARSTFSWYGIHIDDDAATQHTSAAPASAQVTAGHSWIDNGMLTLPSANNGVRLLGGTQSTDMVDSTGQTTLTLQVGSSGSPVTLTKNGGTQLTSTAGTKASLNSLFVTAARDKYASWEICGLEPRRLPTVGVKASGHYQNFEPGMVIDNLIWYTSCFRSQPLEGENWLQIDMGAEFLVEKVVIYPLQYGPDLPLEIMNPTWLNNLQIYVGSCRENKIASNNPCSTGIGTVAEDPADHAHDHLDQEIIIEKNCAADSIGRFVYILPATPTTLIGFCEVRLFGKEVPLDKETKIYIEPANVNVDATEGSPATVTVTRSGAAPTCTHVQYRTDRALDNDFTQVFPAQDLQITGTTTPINIPTTQDTECEGDEKFNVYLTGIDGGVLGFSTTALGSQCHATVTIKDDDEVAYSVAANPATDVTVPESKGTMNIQVSQSTAVAGSASVTFTGSTATSPADFTTTAAVVKVTFDGTSGSQSVPITIVDDSCYEGDETFLIDLKGLTPACSTKQTGLPLSITITENDSRFEFDTSSLTGNTLEISEGGSAGSINVIRTGTADAKTVKFVMHPLEAEIADVTFNPTNMEASFAAGLGTSTISITATDDSNAESTEYFILCLEDTAGANCPNRNLGNHKCIQVKITDNEYKYSFVQPTSTSVSEGGQLQLCLKRHNYANAPSSTIDITAVPISADSQDYSVPGSIIIAAGAESGCTTIGITADQLQESTETFRVELTSGQSGVSGTDSIVITINGDSANTGTGGTGTGSTGTGGTGTGTGGTGTGTGGTGTGTGGTGTGTGGTDGNTGTNTGNTANNDDGGLSTGAIAGIVASAVIGVLIVGTVVVIFCALTGVGPFANSGAIAGTLPPGAQQLVPLDNGNAFGVSSGGFF